MVLIYAFAAAKLRVILSSVKTMQRTDHNVYTCTQVRRVVHANCFVKLVESALLYKHIIIRVFV